MYVSVYDDANKNSAGKTHSSINSPNAASAFQQDKVGTSFSASVFSGLVALFDTTAIFFSSAVTFTLYFGWSVTDQTSYLAASIIATLQQPGKYPYARKSRGHFQHKRDCYQNEKYQYANRNDALDMLKRVGERIKLV